MYASWFHDADVSRDLTPNLFTTMKSLLIMVAFVQAYRCLALVSVDVSNRQYSTRPVSPLQLQMANSDGDQNSNQYTFWTSRGTNVTITDDLTPPLVKFRKESLLFDESSASKYNNDALRLWRGLKSRLPQVLTGARQVDTADDNPLAGIYNMIFVRLPTVAAGFVYGKNLYQGHPLIVDVGNGPWEVNPLFVLATLYVILR